MSQRFPADRPEGVARAREVRPQFGPAPGPNEIIDGGARKGSRFSDAASGAGLSGSCKRVIDEILGKDDTLQIGIYRCADFLRGITRAARGGFSARPQRRIAMVQNRQATDDDWV